VGLDSIGLESRDKDGRSPLSYAAEWGHDAIVRLLVDEYNVEADSRDKMVVRRCHTLQNGATMQLYDCSWMSTTSRQTQGQSGRSPLSYAAECGREGSCTTACG